MQAVSRGPNNPATGSIDLLLLAGWDLRRLLSRVFDNFVPPQDSLRSHDHANRYKALLETFDIDTDDSTIFISLNYDTVLEHALNEARIRWHYRHVHSTVPRHPRSIRVLKPHGSLNWRFRGNVPSVWIDTAYALAPVGCQSYEVNRFKEAMIIPPTQIKQAITVAQTQSPKVVRLFRAIWKETVDVLAAASRVFVIGYSFPPTDLHLRTLFRLVGRKRNSKSSMKSSAAPKATGKSERSSRMPPVLAGGILPSRECGFDSFVSPQWLINVQQPPCP